MPHQIRKQEGCAGLPGGQRATVAKPARGCRAGDSVWGSWVPRCRPAEEWGGLGWKMNLEKYKKFLDGLGTLKGISLPLRWGCAARRDAELLRRCLLWGLQQSPTICHRSPTEANRVSQGRQGAAGFPWRRLGGVVLFHGSA